MTHTADPESERGPDADEFNQQHRGGVLLEQLGIDLHVHPYLGFALPPDHRSAVLNTDSDGFRLSDSPFGTVDSESWLAGGGGGLVLGSSVAYGLAVSADGATLPSRLAFKTGSRWLNLAIPAANSLQELIAAVPYLHAASTVVLFSGLSNYVSMLRTREPEQRFAPIFYGGAFARITRTPLFDLSALANGETVPGLAAGRGVREHEPPRPDHRDAAGRVEAAARLHLRDLAFLARTAGAGCRVLFCLQPLATPRTRAILPEERAGAPAGYDFSEPIHGIPFGVLEDHLDPYADLLEQGCAKLGVGFLRVEAREFVGRSFVTNGVLTDEGTDQAADMVCRALERM